MAIAQMEKVIIVTHRSQTSELLEALQHEGICHILNAEEAMISRDSPDLAATAERPRDIENLLNRITKSNEFLKAYAKPQQGLASMLAPRAVIDAQSYDSVVSDRQLLNIIDQAEQTQAAIEKLNSECENLTVILNMLAPWAPLETPVEEIGTFQQATCLLGLIPSQHLDQAAEQLTELGAAFQPLGTAANKHACIIVALNENITDVQKLLRSADFELVNFERMTGTVPELIGRYQQEMDQAKNQLQDHYDKAASLSENLLNLQILHDHYTNLRNREQTRSNAPATEHTVLFEGWVKKREYHRLEEIVSSFQASSLSKIESAEEEEIPVEIENKNYIRPFEVITRLYGMPQHFEVDPTAFLAPFFAIFFALCLTDAGYGLVIIALMVFFIKKIQGDKKLMWMLGICSAATVVAGALTGGWFGDAIQQFIPALQPLRKKMMWFDPIEKPMIFFALSLILGYAQIIFGIFIAFVYDLLRKQYVAALCDRLTWLVMLNSIVGLVLAYAAVLPNWLGGIFIWTAVIPAATIFLFSQRQGNWGGRLGMGFYQLFSTIFYVGDVLSYVRLMALGMVTAGLAMAINVIAKISLELPYGIGIVLMILILVGGHGFNIAINALGAFVHTLRLQYAEFFPKFIIGGGRLFQPLSKEYKNIYIKKSKDSF